MMAAPFLSAMETAPTDDMMEMSTEAHRDLHPDDDIEIDFDIHEELPAVDHEDERMGDGEEEASYKDDDEMVDDTSVLEDAIVEDAIDYNDKQDNTSNIDEELVDVEEDEPAATNPAHADAEVLNVATIAETDWQDTHAPFLEEEVGVVTDNEHVADTGAEQQSGQGEMPHTYDEVKVDAQIESATGAEKEVSPEPLDSTLNVHEVEDAEHSPHNNGNGAVEEHEGINPAYQEATSYDNVQADDAGKDGPTSSTHQVSDHASEHNAQDNTYDAPQATLSQPGEPHQPVAEVESVTDETVVHQVGDEYMYQATVLYQGNEMLLFPPNDDDKEEQTYLLQDDSLAHQTIKVMLGSCREILGESIEPNEELTIGIPSLGLSFSEDNASSSEVQLASLIDLYNTLQRNDGIEVVQSLSIMLDTTIKKVSKLQALYDTALQGRGLSQIPASGNNANAYAVDDNDDVEHGGQEATTEQQQNIPEIDQEPQTEDRIPGATTVSEPGTPRGTYLRNDDLDADTIDFTTPKKKQEDTSDMTANTEHGSEDTRGILNVESSENKDVTLESSGVQQTDLSDTTAPDPPREPKPEDESTELHDYHGVDLPAAPDNFAEELSNTTNQETSKEPRDPNKDEVPYSTNEEAVAEEHLQPVDNLEDNLDDIEDEGEPNEQLASGVHSSSTVTNDATSTNTLQDDQAEQDAFEDEITFADDDDQEEDELEAPYDNVAEKDDPTNKPVAPDSESSPESSSLKRQRPVDVGDNDDILASSRQPQPDVKRVRADEDS